MLFRLIGISLLLMSMPSLRAAEISTGDFWGMPGIFIIGEIVPGDAQAFAQQAKEMPQAVVVLRSQGGAVRDAVAIGRMIRTKGYWTFVGRRGECASACAVIWLAGTHAVVQRNSYLIFHRAQTADGTESLEGDRYVAAYLRGLGYGDHIIAYVMRAAPSEAPPTMEWHARALGIQYQTVVSLLGSWKSCTAHFCLAIP
jgi:hypothetical protein